MLGPQSYRQRLVKNKILHNDPQVLYFLVQESPYEHTHTHIEASGATHCVIIESLVTWARMFPGFGVFSLSPAEHWPVVRIYLSNWLISVISWQNHCNYSNFYLPESLFRSWLNVCVWCAPHLWNIITESHQFSFFVSSVGAASIVTFLDPVVKGSSL